MGTNKHKLKLKKDISIAWKECKDFYESKDYITGAELYKYAEEIALKHGWKFGGEIAGHLIGHFPHEKLENEDKTNYVHPDNNVDMRAPDKKGNQRDWILEIHFIDENMQIGGFYEQLLTC